MKIIPRILLIFVLIIINALLITSLLIDSEDYTRPTINEVSDLATELANRDDLSKKEGDLLNNNLDINSVKEISIPGFNEVSSFTYPKELEESQLTIRAMGTYTGPYVENGSNLNIKDTLGIVVHNNSNKMIEVCYLTFESKDGTTLSFLASSIPANADVFILEMNQYKVQDDDSFEYKNSTSTYVQDTQNYNNTIKVTCRDKAFAVENTSDKAYNKIYVCYKNKVNNIYFGGITYRVTFENVKPNTIVKRSGNHFNVLSEVVYVTVE